MAKKQKQRQQARRMATRNTPVASTPSTSATVSTEIDAAVHQIAAASRSSVAGSIAQSAATTAAASWVSTHAKVDVFGTGRIWVPPHRTRTLQDKDAKEFLLQIWTGLAAERNITLSPKETSDLIVAAFMNSIFINPRFWSGVSNPFESMEVKPK